MATVILGLGSNLGCREALLSQAITYINERVGEVLRQSAFYETEPWGFESPHPFLNAAVAVSTALSPEEVLWKTQQIERDLGREQKSLDGVYHDRTLDIDLLFYDDCVLEADYTSPDGLSVAHLSLPHPALHERMFVLQPLVDIAPDWVHPVLHCSLKALYLQAQHTR